MVTRQRVQIGIFLMIFYLVTRLPFLTKIPIFTDEAIYIRWGQVALNDPQHRFISLEDGKQPLFIWLMLPLLKFIGDPLMAGRLISNFAGLATMFGIIILTSKLFNQKVGFLAGLIYIVSPFFLLYDRLALYDSLTTAIMVWSMYLSVILAQAIRLDAALLLGMTVGAGLLTKSSAQFSLILLPVSLLLFDFKSPRRQNRIISWCGLALIAAVLALTFQTILKLSPLGYMVGLKNLTFVVSLGEFFTDPFSRIIGNLRGLTNWLVQYLTVPMLLPLIIGITAGIRKKTNITIFILSWFMVPILALAAFGRVLYPRFVLFMAIPLVILMALGLSRISDLLKPAFHRSRFLLVSLSRRSVFFAFCFLLFAFPAYISLQLIVDPVNAAIPGVDRDQLFDNWPSGYGIPEVVSLLKDLSMNEKIFVGTEGTFGLTPYALNIYLRENNNVEIKGYWPISDGMNELIEIAKTGKPTYVLFKDTQTPNPQWPLTLVSKYQKGKGNVHMNFYRVLPPE